MASFQATLVGNEPAGHGARRLVLEPEAGVPPFRGGQFVIVDTGLVLDDGRPRKRAFSIASSDSDPTRLELVVQRVGAGSGQMNEWAVGRQLSFSGPWGKFADVLGAPADGPPVVLAVDTGITAGLGLALGRALCTRTDLTVLWLTDDTERLLGLAEVRRRFAGCAGRLLVGALPSVEHPERPVAARSVWASAQLAPGEAWLVGDGLVLAALAPPVLEAGLPRERLHMEAFFHREALEVVSSG